MADDGTVRLDAETLEGRGEVQADDRSPLQPLHQDLVAGIVIDGHLVGKIFFPPILKRAVREGFPVGALDRREVGVLEDGAVVTRLRLRDADREPGTLEQVAHLEIARHFSLERGVPRAELFEGRELGFWAEVFAEAAVDGRNVDKRLDVTEPWVCVDHAGHALQRDDASILIDEFNDGGRVHRYSPQACYRPISVFYPCPRIEGPFGMRRAF